MKKIFLLIILAIPLNTLSMHILKRAAIGTVSTLSVLAGSLTITEACVQEFNKTTEEPYAESPKVPDFYEHHNEETRSKIQKLAHRLGITSKEFAQIQTCYLIAFKNKEDLAFYESTMKKARKTFEAKFGEYSREALDEEFLFRRKLKEALSSRYREEQFLASAPSTNNTAPERPYIILTPTNITDPEDTMAILH